MVSVCVFSLLDVMQGKWQAGSWVPQAAAGAGGSTSLRFSVSGFVLSRDLPRAGAGGAWVGCR